MRLFLPYKFCGQNFLSTFKLLHKFPFDFRKNCWPSFPVLAFLLHWPRWWNPLWWSLPLQCHFVPGTIFRWPRRLGGRFSHCELGCHDDFACTTHTYTHTRTHNPPPDDCWHREKRFQLLRRKIRTFPVEKSSHSRGVFSTKFFPCFFLVLIALKR